MRSKFGNAVLVDKAGYVYRSRQKKESKIYWSCRDEAKFKCNARAITDGFYIMSMSGEHHHDAKALKKAKIK